MCPIIYCTYKKCAIVVGIIMAWKDLGRQFDPMLSDRVALLSSYMQ